MSLSDGAGGFTNASTAELADEGQALGAAVGDIDNDGNLDLFQAAGGGGEGSFRSLLLLNLGDGQFLDVLESAGLDALANASPATAVFLDVDNDADLDLLIGFPLSLFLNDGRGLFTQATKRLGTTLSVTHMAVADFDRDGFLDVARPSQFLRNLGNANHWLQVDPVGVASNRCGIGTRLVVRSGDLRQVREIAGGNGWEQAEMIAHFGLGGRDRVDSLIVSWPSGQVDRFTDLAVDERIRVVEGRDTYGPAPPTVWAIDAPDAVTDGQAFAARISARVGLFEPEAAVVEAVADFGELGGGRVPLVAVGDDVFELTHELSVVATGGHKEVRVFIDQETSLGRRRTVLGHDVEVWPRTWPMADLPIYGDAGPSGRWEVVSGDVTITEPEGDAAEGARLARLELRSQRFKAAYVLDEPADVGGYQALGFASRPRGAATSIPFGVLYLTLNDEGAKALPLVGTHVSLGDTTEWRRTSVPLSRFWLDGPLTSIQIGGEVTGILEIDDLRLLPGRAPTITAVVESGDETVPESFTLSQNVPNPFNPHTTIRYQLPSAGEVELAVYNLAAQKVTTLALGLRDAGSYAIRWDGRDASGKELASGVYLYRLTAAGRTETRKLLLLR
jgi:hypothetical protein